MAQLSILAGATSQSMNVFIQDATSPLGAGLTGLVFNTTGLSAYYSFAGAAAGSNSVTLATLATLGTAWSSGGFKEIDSTNMPGWYRFDIPNAALASGNGRCVAIHFQGAQNSGGQVVMVADPILIELTGWDNQSTTNGGLSAIPTANPGAANGIFIAGTNANVTISGAGNALTLTSSSGGGSGLVCNGNGAGSAIKATGGSTGNGAIFTGGATSGNGIEADGGTNGAGFNCLGNGSGHGFKTTGGTTGDGILATAGATSGDGFGISAPAGHGLNISSTTSGHGMQIVASGGNGQGLRIRGNGTGDGINAQGGATGTGAHFIGGATSGAGMRAEGTNGNANGAEFVHQGTGQDLLATLVTANFSATSLDNYAVAGQTLSAAIKHIGATTAGKISGAGSGTEVFTDFSGTTAVTVTVDTSGNRTAVTYA